MDPVIVVHIPQSQLAALQYAGQWYLETKPNGSLRAEVAAGIETLDKPYTA